MCAPLGHQQLKPMLPLHSLPARKISQKATYQEERRCRAKRGRKFYVPRSGRACREQGERRREEKRGEGEGRGAEGGRERGRERKSLAVGPPQAGNFEDFRIQSRSPTANLTFPSNEKPCFWISNPQNFSPAADCFCFKVFKLQELISLLGT